MGPRAYFAVIENSTAAAKKHWRNSSGQRLSMPPGDPCFYGLAASVALRAQIGRTTGIKAVVITHATIVLDES